MKLSVLLLLALISCGKKAEVNSRSSESSTQTLGPSASNSDLLISSIQDNDPRSTEQLLKHGANPDQKMSNGETLLTFSIQNNYASLVELLLLNGAKTNLENENGDTPLFIALANRNSILVRLLIVHGCEKNEKDRSGRNALMMAISFRDSELAEWLLDQKIDIDAKDKLNRNAFDYAKQYGLQDLATKINIRMELNSGLTDSSLLLKMLNLGDVRGMRELLSKHPDVIQELQTPSALSLATQMSDEAKALEAVELLLNYQVSPDGEIDELVPPISLAADLGRLKIIKALENGLADLNKLDKSGKTPLIHAVLHYEAQTVEYLVSKKVTKNYELKSETGTLKIEACSFATQAQKSAKNTIQKELAEKIKQHLGCGLRWLIFW
ncbi:MAG: ankyrin repeat domain-containing protein [Bacteriovoracaceae bacterium]|nr:ankyrin repeat domain-containing protein [Bacteriovoracaceae bacterium]